MARTIRLEDFQRESAGLAGALSGGALACLPTDTVYGLACLPGHAGAVERLYELKGRDRGKPLAAVFGSVAQVEELIDGLGPAARRAVRTLLPGPVTAIVAAAGDAAAALSSSLGSPGSVGVRVLPPPLDSLYRELPTPLALTSANLSGQPDPCSLEEVAPQVLAACDFAVDAGRCPLSTPSTVVDLRPLEVGEPAAVIREGAVSARQVRQRLSTGDSAP